MAGGKGGRPPVPTSLKLIKGTARKDRVQADEPKPEKGARLPAPPAHLGKIAKNEWKRVAKHLFDLELLTLVDKEALALYCKAVQDEREACGRLAHYNMQKENAGRPNLMPTAIEGSFKTHPWVTQRDTARKVILEFAREFGMTPSSRTRVRGTVQPKTKSPFEQFK